MRPCLPVKSVISGCGLRAADYGPEPREFSVRAWVRGPAPACCHRPGRDVRHVGQEAPDGCPAVAGCRVVVRHRDVDRVRTLVDFRIVAGPTTAPVLVGRAGCRDPLLPFRCPSKRPPGLTDREVGRLPLGRLALRTRQRRANQRPVHGPFLVGCPRNRLLGFGFDSFNGVGRVGRSLSQLPSSLERDRVRLPRYRQLSRRQRPESAGPPRSTGAPATAATGFFRRAAGTFACLYSCSASHVGAACLLHVVFDHRDNRMVGDAALARTIVV